MLHMHVRERACTYVYVYIHEYVHAYVHAHDVFKKYCFDIDIDTRIDIRILVDVNVVKAASGVDLRLPVVVVVICMQELL